MSSVEPDVDQVWCDSEDRDVKITALDPTRVHFVPLDKSRGPTARSVSIDRMKREYAFVR